MAVSEKDGIPYYLHMSRKDGLTINILTKNDEAGLALAEKFKDACYDLPKSLKWFHQGGSLPNGQTSNWHMFEFWTDKDDDVILACSELASKLDLVLKVHRPTFEDVQIFM